MAMTEGTWLSILEYSNYKRVSISTIRRHIKANLVKWKEQEGKYLIWTPAASQEIANKKEGEFLALKLELKRLEMENRMLVEELAEAKMLIRLYEANPLAAEELNS